MTTRTILRRALAFGLALATGLTATVIAVAGGDPYYPPGEIVIKVEPGTDVDALLDEIAGDLLDPMLASHGIYLVGVPVADMEKWQKDAEKIGKEIAKLDGVVYAEPNHDADIAEADRFHYWGGTSSFLGEDPALRDGQVAVAELGLAELHQRATGDGVVVAVLDTGVDLDHPDLAGHLVPGYDYIDDDTAPDDTANGVDDDGDGLVDEGVGHGSHAAGLITLVAPDARIMPMRVLDSDGQGSLFITAEAIVDAVHAGADVINLSFGMSTEIESDVVKDALKVAKKAEVVIVAAAGNDASGEKHYPAAANEVLSVGALDHDGNIAAFSNRGKWVVVAAPGTNLVSTVPGGYGSWSGTSMAAPVITGGVAVLKELNPEKTRKANDVLKAMKKSGEKLPDSDTRSIIFSRFAEFDESED